VSNLAAISTFVSPLRGVEHDSRPLHRTERRRQSASRCFKFVTFLIGQLDHIGAAAGHANKFAAGNITPPHNSRTNLRPDH
jgi:hypothetical protein